jgi:hypothetical protein
MIISGLWAFKISKDMFVIAFGEEINIVKDFVMKNFTSGR